MRKFRLDDENYTKSYNCFHCTVNPKDALSKMQLGAWEYDVIAPNYKCNLTDIMFFNRACSIKRYDGLLARRAEIVKKYYTALRELR